VVIFGGLSKGGLGLCENNSRENWSGLRGCYPVARMIISSLTTL